MFREELCRQLGQIEDDDDVPLIKSKLHPTADKRFQTEHLPMFDNKRHNCRICYVKNDEQVKTQVFCSADSCQGKYLCMNAKINCYNEWHSASFNGSNKYFTV